MTDEHNDNAPEPDIKFTFTVTVARFNASQHTEMFVDIVAEPDVLPERHPFLDGMASTLAAVCEHIAKQVTGDHSVHTPHQHPPHTDA